MTTTPSTLARTPEPGFSSVEDEALTGYRPVSRLAIVSLVLGLLSAAALLHPLLWILPILAVLLAGIAFRQTVAPASELRGTGLALTAISLGIPVRLPCRVLAIQFSAALDRQASEYSTAWLELVRQGRLKEAHQLTMYSAERLSPDVSLEEAYAKREKAKSKTDPGARAANDMEGADLESLMTESLSDRFRSFFAGQPLAKLIALDRTWKAQYRESVGHSRLSQYTREVAQRFVISYQDRGQPQTMDVVVVVERTRVGREANWRIQFRVRSDRPPLRTADGTNATRKANHGEGLAASGSAAVGSAASGLSGGAGGGESVAGCPLASGLTAAFSSLAFGSDSGAAFSSLAFGGSGFAASDDSSRGASEAAG